MNQNKHLLPVAISRLGEGIEKSREPQNLRAIKWLSEQPGGPITVVTPRKEVESDILTQLIKYPGVTHLSWRGLNMRSLAGRVLFAWPSRQHLNDLWGVKVDALAVIEWNPEETQEWIEDNKPLLLLHDGAAPYIPASTAQEGHEPLPNDVEEILTYLALWAEGYDSGLKWNEEHKLKADMMNRPERWSNVTGDQIRTKCRELGMRPNDIDTIIDIVQRGKEGRRFRVEKGYRNFRFD